MTTIILFLLTYTHLQALAGNVAFVGQSGMLGSAVLDWAVGRGIGFSHFLTLGDTMDVDLADVLDYLAGDRGTKAVLVQLEQVRNPARFISALKATARSKPILVFRSSVPSNMEQLPGTPGLLQREKVWDAVFHRCGVFQVDSAVRLFDALETLTRLKPFRGGRLAIITNGIGPGMLARDELQRLGGVLAQIGHETYEGIGKLLPPFWQADNPVDVFAGCNPKAYAKALEMVSADPNVDAVLAILVPTLVAPTKAFAKAVVAAEVKADVFSCWMGLASVREAREIFDEAGMPTYQTPEEAIRAFMDRVHHEHNQEVLHETPRGIVENTADLNRVHQLIKRATDSGRNFLMPDEAHELLRAYDIPTADAHLAETIDEAVAHQQTLGQAVALKVLHEGHLQPFAYHGNTKNWRHGIAMDLDSPGRIRRAAERMERRMSRLYPEDRVWGYLVQKMRRGFGGVLLHLGITRDPMFGPMILCGEGGSLVNMIADRQVGLPPLNMNLAADLFSRSKVDSLLENLNEHANKHRRTIRELLVKLANIATDFPEISGLEINPVLIRDKTFLSLDVTVSLGPPAFSVIRPYPTYLREKAVLKSGREIELRPIRGEDEPAHDVFASKLSREAIRYRFFTPIARLSHKQLAQLTQVDYDREMAFIATAVDELGESETLGVVRGWTDSDNFSSEFAVIVRDDLYGQGLGRLLLQKQINYSRSQGTIVMVGTILPENQGMQGLARKMGFKLMLNREDRVVESLIQLNEPSDEWQRQRLTSVLAPYEKSSSN